MSSIVLPRSPTKLPTLSDIAARLNSRDSPSLTPSNSPLKQLAESPRRRLELTGRILASPKQAEMPPSPTKERTEGSQSGSSSPTKRMLATGLPSLDEIADRMARKGVVPTPPGSPTKLGAKRPIEPSSVAAGEKKAALSITTVTRPLTHPLPAAPLKSPSPSPSKYPLQHEWSLYFDSRSSSLPPTPSFGPPSPLLPHPPTPTLTASNWEANLRSIGAYFTVPAFLSVFSKLHRPSQLPPHSSYHLFKDGIKPMWEDTRNAAGGKWTITFRQKNQALVDRSWLWLVLGLIGEQLDEKDEVTGAVVSVKPRGDRIALWVRSREGKERAEGLGKRLMHLLELGEEPGLMVEFSDHEGKKVEGWWAISNTVQMVRTPTINTFGPPPPVTPTSPSGKRFALPRSPVAASPNTETGAQFGRLNGQPHMSLPSNKGANVFARSPGSLGKSLGLGIGSSSPSLSDFPKRPPLEGAFSWRSNGSVSPQRRSASPTKAS